MFAKKPEPYLTLGAKFKYFMTAYWRGVLVVLTPFCLIPVLLPLPSTNYQWVLYVLLMMALFWVTECMPLAVTSFLPVLFFPLAGVMTSEEVCSCYCSDAVLMFLGSIFLAFSVEQSGFHKRLAYFVVRSIGYSHYKLLFAMCVVTTFVSMWITNTAATTMMVPIIQALLKVFEEQKVLKMYTKDADGNDVASDFTVVYFCAATYSATIGGIGTLVGTGTNLVFKGFFMDNYPDEPEHLSFPLFSAFGAPMMVVLEAFNYLCLVITFFGFGRPKSEHAKRTIINPAAKAAAKKTIDDAAKKLGKLTYWEVMVIILFGGAMVAFFCRSPQIFKGWGDLITEYNEQKIKPAYIKDSSLAMLVVMLMFLFPSCTMFFKNFTAKYHEDLPKGPVPSVLIWKICNVNMPFAFMFLLGGGFALSTASKSSGLNEKIGEQLRALKPLPNNAILFMLITVVILVTNFASNIAVCNVFTPIAMQMAGEINQDPLWYNIASGFAASFCFMLPVGTPGNLVVQGKANIATAQMIKAGFGTTITTIIITWVFMCFWAPVIWPSIVKK